MTDPRVIQWLDALRRISPVVYTRVLARYRRGLGGIFDSIDWGNLVDTTFEIGKGYLNQKQAEDLMREQQAIQQQRLEQLQLQRQLADQQAAQERSQQERILKLVPWFMAAIVGIQFIRG